MHVIGPKMFFFLQGGSVVSLLAEYLAKVETDWSKWRFFFCDERLVEFSDPESTFAQYRDKFIINLPISEDQFIKINPQLSGKYRVHVPTPACVISFAND